MDPYGNPLGQPQGALWPDKRGFLGKPVSETTGLTDIGARKYDASTGRFISVDPILDAGDAQQMTGYCYANNNPTTLSDPTGLIAAGSQVIFGLGTAGVANAYGQVRDLQALNSNSYQMGVTYLRGFISLFPGFVGPRNGASYIPFVIIGVTFSFWGGQCPTPVAQGTREKPAFTAPKMTRVEEAQWDAKQHPVRPPVMTDTEFILAITGIDQAIECFRDPSVGQCAMAALPFVAGPLGKGASLGVRAASRPKHIAEVAVLDAKGSVRAGAGDSGPSTYFSGRQIPAEKSQGKWKGGMVSHTEARATRVAGSPYPYWRSGDDPVLGSAPAVSGDTYFLQGGNPPCSWCSAAMEEAAERTGTNWVYSWMENDVRQFWWRGPNG